MRRSANGVVKRNKTPQKNNNVENDDGEKKKMNRAQITFAKQLNKN